MCYTQLIGQSRRQRTSAVWNGSKASGSGGACDVFTAQNLHPLVQVSPNSMIVPVPPFQHSPMLGHCASSHTVCKLSSFSEDLSSSYWAARASKCAAKQGSQKQIGKSERWEKEGEWGGTPLQLLLY